MVSDPDLFEVRRDTMPRFILDLAPSNGFYKSLVDNPRDRMTELAPVMQQAGLTWEQRYYVVGENKLIDIVSGDSDAVQSLLLAVMSTPGFNSATCREITTSAETVPILQQAKESSFRPPSDV